MPTVSEFQTDAVAAGKYDEVQFKASHNSYAKNALLGTQLNFDAGEPHRFGCRGLELDLYQGDDDFDWSVKHFEHHKGKDFAGYLDSLLDWSSQRPGHDVVTVTLDLKNVTDEPADFPDLFDEYLESQGFEAQPPPADVEDGDDIQWPTLVTPSEVLEDDDIHWLGLAELRGRFVFCLSGKEEYKSVYAQQNGRLCFADRKAGNVSYLNMLGDGDSRIFFNFDMGHWRQASEGPQLPAGYVSRVYGVRTEYDWTTARDLGFNLLAVDGLSRKWCHLESMMPFANRQA